MLVKQNMTLYIYLNLAYFSCFDQPISHISAINKYNANINLLGSFSKFGKLYLLNSPCPSHDPLTNTCFIFYFPTTHRLILYALAWRFQLYFNKYFSLQLKHYQTYYLSFFGFKILVIEHLELIPVNIVIDKLVFYKW